MLRKKEFIERVAARTDAKMGQVRDITEAVLAELGDALSKGETLSLSPLGKLRVNRQVERSEHEVLVVKIRRSTDGDDANDEGGEKTDTDPLAEDGQDS
jgi:DNA-binding protein HU-alpha